MEPRGEKDLLQKTVPLCLSSSWAEDEEQSHRVGLCHCGVGRIWGAGLLTRRELVNLCLPQFMRPESVCVCVNSHSGP